VSSPRRKKPRKRVTKSPQAPKRVAGPVVLAIMDGFGLREETKGNAIAQANTPNLDKFFHEYPFAVLSAAGTAVGLPDGYIGNSEVGHLTIGSGRIIDQDLRRINKAMMTGSFFTNKAFLEAVKHIKRTGARLHLMGLLSDAGVHSHLNHLFALLELASHHFLPNVYIHCFLDGRDTDPYAAKKYIRILDKHTKKLGIGCIASVVGRYYAMDRDNRWNRTQKAYELLVHGKGILIRDPMEAVNLAYRANLTDEFVKPTLLNQNGTIREGDTVIFFNFRSDRARQITKAFTQTNFKDFKRKPVMDLHFVTMTSYDDHFKTPVAFEKREIVQTLSEVVSKHRLKQLKVAETEKFAHVTYFLNGGKEKHWPNEDRVLVPSERKVPTYDKKPEMEAAVITRKVINGMKKKYRLIILNYANCDMVGHSGKLPATIKAVETVDQQLGKLAAAVEKAKGILLITADHGNAEAKEDKFGRPQTAHTTNPVPFILVNKKYKLAKKGGLSDIAPTILQLLKIKKPLVMTAKGLLKA